MSLMYNTRRIKLSLIAICLLSFFSFSVNLFGEAPVSKEAGSPYGAHSHIYRSHEWRHFPKNLTVMREGGIRWMRTDFLWDLVEKKKGEWDFSQYDQIVAESEKQGIHILGILGYSVDWARPAYENQESWLEYVTRTVERYKGRVSAWEVWNEENIEGFWKNPNPENYTAFLKATYEAVHKADPSASVLFGGTAAIPFDFLEKCLKADAGKFFDVMAIHPYRTTMKTPEALQRFQNDLLRVRELMTKYGVGDKPIWITEMGWSDFEIIGGSCREFIAAALSILSPEHPVQKVTFLHDPAHYTQSILSKRDLTRILPEGIDASFVTLKELRKLDPKTAPYLILPPGEKFPGPYFDDLYAYTRDGGTLFFLGGFPCYYNTKEVNGFCEKVPGENTASEYRRQLRIDTHVWWMDPTKTTIPKRAKIVKPSPETARFFKELKPDSKADLFFGSALLKGNDKLIPVLYGQTDSFSEPVALIYKFNSDLKGNIAIYSLYEFSSLYNYIAPNEMGIYLPQAYLVALSSGIEKFFMYQFQAMENTPTYSEDHFGLLHKDLTPKPGYLPLKVMTQARPDGSVSRPGLLQNGICVLSWDRPDGRIGWALWSPSEEDRPVTIDGNIEEAFDYMGQEVKLPEKVQSLRLSPKTLYLIGPKNIHVKGY